MIPKGNLHANGGKLATYITKGEDDEKAELIEMRGFATDDLREAFSDRTLPLAPAMRDARRVLHAVSNLVTGHRRIASNAARA